MENMKLNETTTVKVSKCLFLLKSKGWYKTAHFFFDFASWATELIRTCDFKWAISIHIKNKSIIVANYQGKKLQAPKYMLHLVLYLNIGNKFQEYYIAITVVTAYCYP